MKLLKKGQAAMEFLMTYGWALLIILIAIGALAYFGVLNPSKLLPESCILPSGFSCVDFVVDATPSAGPPAFEEIHMTVTNNIGADLTAVRFTMIGDVSTSPSACAGILAPAAATAWNEGATLTLDFNCAAAMPVAGQKFKSDVTIAYTKGGIPHTKTGRIVATVE